MQLPPKRISQKNVAIGPSKSVIQNGTGNLLGLFNADSSIA